MSTVQDKKTHSLQVKGLYNRAGIDQVKRLKIMDQLQYKKSWNELNL